MRRKIQFLIALLSVPLVLNAQTVDDDMYFVPSKKKATETKTTVSQTSQPTMRQTLRVPVSHVDTVADYHTGALRDVDDYNRRGTKMSARLEGDTLYLDTIAERRAPAYRDYDDEGYYDDYGYYDDDYIYSSRLMRYRGYHFYDPFMWDFCYGWYDPWYDPWYGWYGPYYRHGFYSWYDWGWGWHHRPGWDLSGIMAGIPALTTATTTPAIAAISTAMADVVSAPALQAMPVVPAVPAAVVSARRQVLVVQVHSMVRAAQ